MPVKRKWQEQTSILTLPCSRFHWSDSGSFYSASLTQNPLLSQRIIHPIPHKTYSFWLFCVLGWPGETLFLTCVLTKALTSLLTALLPTAFCQSRFPKGSPLDRAFISLWLRGSRLLLSPLLSSLCITCILDANPEVWLRGFCSWRVDLSHEYR